MPRVTHVKRAQKDNPVCKAGEPYYWWKFRFGGKHFSLTPPRSSQLTQSPYLSMVRGLSEQIADHPANEPADLEMLRDEIAPDIGTAGEECQESLDNMPEGLQEGDTGQMLQERIESCENAQSELESIDLDFTSEHTPEDKEITQEDRDQELQDWLDEKKDEMTELIDACEI